MLYLFHAVLEKPVGMTHAEFYGLWEKESEAAAKLMEGGEAKMAFKFAGSDELIAIFDVDSHARIDEIQQNLPIWQFGMQHVVKKVSWRPIREYGEWFQHLKVLASNKS